MHWADWATPVSRMSGRGKRFELEVDETVGDDELAEIAETLLANTVIEDWSVTGSSRERPARSRRRMRVSARVRGHHLPRDPR